MPRLLHILPLLLFPFALGAQDTLTMPGHVTTGEAATAITTTTTGEPRVVVTGEGITVNGTEVAVTSTTGGCSVTDAGGTLYAADENGRVTEVGQMPGSAVSAAEYRATASEWNHLDASAKVHFTNDDDLWAFDQYNDKYKDAAAFASAYEDLEGYRVPWKLVPAGKWGKVTATLTGSVPKPDSVVFRTPKGTVYHARRSGKNYSLTIVSGREHDVQEVYALYPAADSGYISLGKLCVATYPMQARRLTIVPVAGADAPGADNTADKLNDIYRPYGIEWTVTVADNWNNTSWDITTTDGLVEADGVALFSSYTDEMKALIAAYRGSGVTIAPESPYIFVVPGFRNSNSTLLGDMPLSLQFGFVAEGANRDMVHTIAHELGHGVYQLWHTFSSRYSLEQESTSNLMDYTVGGTELIKKQWDLVHDPASIMLAWAVDEEEGEIIVERFKFTYDVTKELAEKAHGNQLFVVNNSGAINLFSDILTNEINQKLKSVNNTGQSVFVIVDLFTYTETSDIDIVKKQVDKQIESLKDANPNSIIIAAIGYKLVDINNVPLQEKPDLLIRSEFFTNATPSTSDFENWRTITETNETQVKSFVDDLIAALPKNPIFNGENCLELAYSDLGIQSAKEINPNDVKQWVSSFAGDNGVTIDYSYTGYPIVNNLEMPTASLNQPENSNADINIAVHFDDNGKKIIICHHYKAGAIVIPSVTASGEPVQETTVDAIVGLSKVYAAKALANAKAGGEKLQALFNSAVKGVVAAKTWTKTICDKMEVPQTCWNDIDHKQAFDRNPYKIEPVTSGVVDGTFDEIKSIPELITLTLDVAFDKEVRNHLWESVKSISWEDIKNFPVKMVKDKASTYSKGGSIAKHEGGKDGVAVASMFFGFGSAKKAKELAETVGKNSTDYAKALQKAYDKIDVSKIEEFGVKLDNLGGGVTGVKLKKLGNTNHTTIAKIDINGNLSFVESEHVFEAVYEIEKKGGTKGYCVLDKADDGKVIFRETTKEVGELLAKRRKWLNDLKSKYGPFDAEKNFKPQGLDATNVPVGIKDEMLAEYPFGLADRIKFRDNLLKSGSDIPIKVDYKKGQELYKIVPKGEEVSDFTPFWMTLNELNSIKAIKNIEQKLGIPLESHSVEYEIYKIIAIKDTKTFESTVAKTIESGYTTSGGAKQILVINRDSWSNAEKLSDKIIPNL